MKTNIKARFWSLLLLPTVAVAVVLETWTSVQAQTVLNSESAAGTVVAWGLNNSGQTNVPAGLGDVVAIAAGGNHNVALKQNGTVVAWEDNTYGQTNVPAGLGDVMAISAGGYHTVALKQDATVVAWGYNAFGQTNVPASLSGVTAIAAGYNHTVALKQDGTVVAWGNDNFGQTTVPEGLSNVVAITGGASHILALKQDGTVVAWGNNDNGQTNVPAGLSGVTAIEAGDFHTVASKQDGTIVAWGYNYFGQSTVPAGLSNVIAIAAGGNHTVVIARLPPSITAQPLSQTVTVGQSASVSVTVRGSGTLNYQWFKDTMDVPGATNATYTIPEVADSDAGIYSAVVTNSAGSVTSASAVVTVLDTPIFATHPLTQTVGVGSNVTLSAKAYGAPPLVFQWYFNGSPVGSPITGTNVSSYTLTNVQTNQSGNYHVQVFNGYGSAISSDAALSVVVFPPSIALHPSNQSPLLGDSASFAVSVSGTPPFRYQWQFNGANIPGATNATYTIPAVAESDGGNYLVIVANSAGSVASANAVLWIIVPPRLGLQMLAGYPVISLHGMLGSNFNVQYVTSLTATNWVNLRTIPSLSATPFQFLDTAGSTSPARYYRAVMQ